MGKFITKPNVEPEMKFITNPNIEPETNKNEKGMEGLFMGVMPKPLKTDSTDTFINQSGEMIASNLIESVNSQSIPSLNSLQDAIIWSEILGKPLSKRRLRRNTRAI